MKKGFTLIELLAVIVILAILALVSTPIVNSLIGRGKSGALESSVDSYVKDIESAYAEWMIEGIPESLTYTNDTATKTITFTAAELNDILNIKGTKPNSGNIIIDNNYDDSKFFGYVIKADLKYKNGYNVQYSYNNDTNHTGERRKIVIEEK